MVNKKELNIEKEDKEQLYAEYRMFVSKLGRGESTIRLLRAVARGPYRRVAALVLVVQSPL